MIKNKKLVLPMLVLVLCIVAFIWIAVDEMNRDAGFSEEYVLAEELPALLSFTYYDIEGWEQQIASIAEGKLSYQELAYEVMKLFLTDFTEDELKTCIARAYDDKFDTAEIAPLKKAGGVSYLELFHGATIAFKDMALSI